MVNGVPLELLGDQRVRVVPAGPNAAVVVASTVQGNLDQLVLRLVTNSGSGLGRGDIVGLANPNGGRLLLGAVDTQTFVVKLLVVGTNSIEEYRFDISGDQLAQQAATGGSNAFGLRSDDRAPRGQSITSWRAIRAD